jgi:glucose/arabinose dehydrogenase
MRPFKSPASLATALLLIGIAGTTRAVPPGDLALTPVITTVIQQPIAVRNAADGSNRLFIVGRNGQIWIRSAAGTMLSTPFLNIGPGGTAPPLGFSVTNEGGLLGLAFHPNYATNRQFYISYTDGNEDAQVVRYLAQAGNPSLADTSTAQIVLRVDSDETYHLGGDIHFGPGGFLYIARGESKTPCDRAQTLRPSQLPANDDNDPLCPADPAFSNAGGNPNSRALQGKILRIDVSTTTPAGANELCASSAGGAANYAIPAGNPYAGSAGTAGNCDEIWAYGLRNPFRFSFDRSNGDMIIGDVGEGDMEEVDFEAATSPGGRNYGWRCVEGTLPTGQCTPPVGAIAPILTYTHAANAGPCASITGGFRYRGAIAGMDGLYFYSDYCSGKIQYGTFNGSTWTATLWQNGTDLMHTSFGEDEAGELYLAEINNDRVLKFTSASVPTSLIFANGFE